MEVLIAAVEKINFTFWRVNNAPLRERKAIRKDSGIPLELFGLVDHIEITDDLSRWEAAYSGIKSCMQGEGALCHKAYTLHGCKLLVAEKDGQIVGRCLVSAQGKLAPKFYGAAMGQVITALKLFHVEQCRSVVPRETFGISHKKYLPAVWVSRYGLTYYGEEVYTESLLKCKTLADVKAVLKKIEAGEINLFRVRGLTAEKLEVDWFVMRNLKVTCAHVMIRPHTEVSVKVEEYLPYLDIDYSMI